MMPYNRSPTLLQCAGAYLVLDALTCMNLRVTVIHGWGLSTALLYNQMFKQF